MHTKFLIIGNSAAGIAAARTLRKLNPHASIVVVSDEMSPAYNKCFIADFVAGAKSHEQVITLNDVTAQELGLQMLYATRVVNIASDNKKVMLSSGEYITYDALLIATGSRPWMPSLPDVRSDVHIYNFATYADADAILHAINNTSIKQVVVVGAGLSGLEIADALHARGLHITVVEHSKQLLARHLNAAGAQIIERAIHATGNVVYTGATLASIQYEQGQVVGVTLADGLEIACDMLVFATGMRQNSELAQQVGIVCDVYGIVVNEYMQTSAPHIYAAGDVIGVYDHLSNKRHASCTWPDAMQQGMHAAYAMSGQPRTYMGTHLMVSSAFFGLKFASCGLLDQVPNTYQIIEQTQEDMYHRFLVNDGVLKGFITVGTSTHLTKLKRMLLTQEPFVW